MPAQKILQGGGKMGVLIHNFDWRNNPLGIEELWPQSLRTTLSILLNSRSPMLLCWGPELICFYNDAYIPNFGINGKHPSALGSPAEKLWPETWHIIKPLYDDILNGADTCYRENQYMPVFRNNKIEYAYWTCSYSPVLDESGSCGAVLVTCYEAGNMVNASGQDSEEKYRMIFNNSPMPKWIYDVNTLEFIEVNEAAIKQYGYSREEFLNMTIRDIRPEEDIPNIEVAISKLPDDVSRLRQWRHLKKDGSMITVEVIGHKIDYGGRKARMVVINDISEIIRAQEEIMRINLRFRYAAKATSDAIWERTEQEDLITWGAGFYTLFGYDASIKNNTEKFWISKIHPEDVDSVFDTIREAKNNKNTNTWSCEYRFLKADGDYAFVREKAIIIRDDNNNVLKMVGALQDITEIKNKETALQHLNEELIKRANELVASNAELEQFAYIASHDLQEPLRMVTSFLSLLEKKYENQLDDKAKMYIHFATDGATRMRKIILDLLDYSRLERKEYLFEEVDMNGLVAEAIHLNSMIIKETGSIIEYNNLPVIYASKVSLARVFQNLITNAIKYGKEGVLPLVKITIEDKKDHWLCAVSDNGIGINPRFFEKIFILFQRLHNKDSYSGTGIGLAICKKIIEYHHGRIWVESKEGIGSVFYFSLPKQNKIILKQQL
jgi:two-component system CheB/CheR fusion protein